MWRDPSRSEERLGSQKPREPPEKQGRLRRSPEGLHRSYPARSGVRDGLLRASLVRHAKGSFDAALLDFTEAIRLDPKLAWSFNGRGVTWKAQGDIDAALRDYGEAIRLDPKYAIAYSNRAWVRATNKDAKYRDGKQAVEDATRACELTDWKDTAKLRTLAAAFAESGEFNKAIEWQTKAMELAQADKQASYRSRLNLYRSGKPYRESREGE